METKKLFDGEYEVTSEGEVFSLKKGGCRLLKGRFSAADTVPPVTVRYCSPSMANRKTIMSIDW